ncbi:MAG: HD domain-containing protein [Planctomycetes bacterium]|nr:HD domain-containing protein [Planctomycetota bacterium]
MPLIRARHSNPVAPSSRSLSRVGSSRGVYLLNILIASADAQAASDLTRFLHDEGHDTAVCSGIDRAIRLLQTPDLNCLLTTFDDSSLAPDLCEHVHRTQRSAEHSLFIVGCSDPTSSARHLAQQCGVDDHLDTPWNRVDTAISLAALPLPRNDVATNTNLRSVNRRVTALGSILSTRHDAASTWCTSHAQRMSLYVRAIAEALPHRGYCLLPTFIDDMASACCFHDVGNAAVPHEVLHAAGILDPLQFDAVKRHTLHGSAILATECQTSPIAILASEIALSHHERWDGSGYPTGLAGADIPLSARIVAICDAYDGMRSSRSYRGSMSHDAATRGIYRCAGTQFDPELVEVFKGVEKRFERVFEVI